MLPAVSSLLSREIDVALDPSTPPTPLIVGESGLPLAAAKPLLDAWKNGAVRAILAGETLRLAISSRGQVIHLTGCYVCGYDGDESGWECPGCGTV